MDVAWTLCYRDSDFRAEPRLGHAHFLKVDLGPEVENCIEAVEVFDFILCLATGEKEAGCWVCSLFMVQSGETFDGGS